MARATEEITESMARALTWIQAQGRPVGVSQLWPAGIPRTTFHGLRRRALVTRTDIEVASYVTGEPMRMPGWSVSAKGMVALARYQEKRHET